MPMTVELTFCYNKQEKRYTYIVIKGLGLEINPRKQWDLLINTSLKDVMEFINRV